MAPIAKALLSLLSLLALLAPAQQAPARTPFKWFTQLGDQAIARADAVLLGRVDSVTPMPGADVVRIAITTWYHGERKEGARDVTLLASPGDFFAGSEQLLFLKRYQRGPRFTLHNRVDRSDPDFDAKLRTLAKTVALEKVAREEDRRRAVRKMLYDGAAERDPWARWNAFHELEYVRKAYPDLVTPEDRDDLTRVAARSDDEAFKKSLLKLLKEWSK